jgi:hypothetical protein
VMIAVMGRPCVMIAVVRRACMMITVMWWAMRRA